MPDVDDGQPTPLPEADVHELLAVHPAQAQDRCGSMWEDSSRPL